MVERRGRVLLVEHTYVRGWHMPGGGVERGETAAQAMARELVEEAGVKVTAPPKLVARPRQPRRISAATTCCSTGSTAWEPCAATSRGEIRRIGWFAPDALPEGTHRRHPPADRRGARSGAHPHW